MRVINLGMKMKGSLMLMVTLKILLLLDTFTWIQYGDKKISHMIHYICNFKDMLDSRIFTNFDLCLVFWHYFHYLGHISY